MTARVASNFYTNPIGGLRFLVRVHFKSIAAKRAAIRVLLFQDLVHHGQRSLLGVGFHSHLVLNPTMEALAPLSGQIKSAGTGNFK